jgi:hypothetical protein
MERRNVTIDEVIATFSSHVSDQYPPPKDFRRNFRLLLEGKRKRADEGLYIVSLEKNIVFLSSLVAEGEALLGRLLRSASPSGPREESIAGTLEAMEKAAHERTARLHTEAFVEGKRDEFEELRRDRSAGGAAYVDKLEFNYRYLMSLRIFLFEFVSVLAALRSQYSIEAPAPDAMRKIRNYLEVTVHYYLGNVAVGEAGAREPGDPEAGGPEAGAPKHGAPEAGGESSS